MLATITIDIDAGISQRTSFAEACRLSQLFGVGIRYDFNGTDVLVKGTRLVYALDKGGDRDTRFIAAVTNDKEE